MKANDLVRVFHGTAILTGLDPERSPQNMVFGIDALGSQTSHYHSGPTHYKYRGLYVAPTYEHARHFGILVFEFAVKARNLHATDWSAKISKRWDTPEKELAARCDDLYPASFNPTLSCGLDAHEESKGRLFRGVEPQALFLGMAPASDILAVYYMDKKYTPKEFMEAYKDDLAWGTPATKLNFKSTRLSLDQYLDGIIEIHDWHKMGKDRVVKTLIRMMEINPEDFLRELMGIAPFSIAAAKRFTQLLKKEYPHVIEETRQRIEKARAKHQQATARTKQKVANLRFKNLKYRLANPFWWEFENGTTAVPIADILAEFDEMIELQCSSGNWDFDPYMHGMANGMIFMRSLVSGGDPQYLEAPSSWLSDRTASTQKSYHAGFKAGKKQAARFFQERKPVRIKNLVYKKAAPKAEFTGWTCISGPAIFVDWLVYFGEVVEYDEFAEAVDIGSLDLEEWQKEMMPTDYHVTFLRTTLPSGQEAWVMQHSGIEHLCLEPGVDYYEEAQTVEELNELALEHFDTDVTYLKPEEIVMLQKKLKVGSLRYKKAERSTVYDDQYFRWEGLLFHVFALLRSKTGANLPGQEAGFTKRVKTIPSSLKKDLKGEHLVAAKEAAEAGELWFIRVGTKKQGEGWLWSKGSAPNPNGAAKVGAIHEVLTFLQHFRSTNTVSGAEAFFIEINNNTLG
jgi:hypothetical protein